MGVRVEIDGTEVWATGLREAELFCSSVWAFEHLAGWPSGLAELADDVIEVDGSVFRDFLLAVVERLRHEDSATLWALAGGALQLGLALDARAHGSWLALTPDVAGLVAEAKARHGTQPVG